MNRLGRLAQPAGLSGHAGYALRPTAEKDPVSFAILYYLVRFHRFNLLFPVGTHGGAPDVYAFRGLLPAAGNSLGYRWCRPNPRVSRPPSANFFGIGGTGYC